MQGPLTPGWEKIHLEKTDLPTPVNLGLLVAQLVKAPNAGDTGSISLG